MGSRNSKSVNTHLITKADFKKEYLIGKGGFSQVWKISMKNKKGKFYAMKQISKAMIIYNKTSSSFLNELEFLSQIRNPFIIQMHYAFQDKYYLYIIMDYYTGGDLRYHLMNGIRFNEEQTSKYFCKI